MRKADDLSWGFWRECQSEIVGRVPNVLCDNESAIAEDEKAFKCAFLPFLLEKFRFKSKKSWQNTYSKKLKLFLRKSKRIYSAKVKLKFVTIKLVHA